MARSDTSSAGEGCWDVSCIVVRSVELSCGFADGMISVADGVDCVTVCPMAGDGDIVFVNVDNCIALCPAACMAGYSDMLCVTVGDCVVVFPVVFCCVIVVCTVTESCTVLRALSELPNGEIVLNRSSMTICSTSDDCKSAVVSSCENRVSRSRSMCDVCFSVLVD